MTTTSPTPQATTNAPAVEFRAATLRFGQRTLWQDVNIAIRAGEFVAILGPNGAGKSTLLKSLLGQVPLSAGTVQVHGQGVRRGSIEIGYVPQQKSVNATAPLRGYDLVKFGLTGHRWGLDWPNRRVRERVTAAITQVGASDYAFAPITKLSGGELQRLRIAQALVTSPRLLLCDEPLLSLDIASQQQIVNLIDRQRRELNLAVLFVTHEINPILPFVDRVIYLARGRAVVGTPQQVMQSAVLSDLYGSRVEVIHEHGRILVFTDDDSHHHDDHSNHQLEA